ncbi:MAG: hypothetical protein ACI814_003955 [Mariniblastus sp.]|jgi:hypothetical protein
MEFASFRGCNFIDIPTRKRAGWSPFAPSKEWRLTVLLAGTNNQFARRLSAIKVSVANQNDLMRQVICRVAGVIGHDQSSYRADRSRLISLFIPARNNVV